MHRVLRVRTCALVSARLCKLSDRIKWHAVCMRRIQPRNCVRVIAEPPCQLHLLTRLLTVC